MRRSQGDALFDVHRGRLVRWVHLKDGRTYRQHCTLDVFKEVALLIETRSEAGVTTTELWDTLPNLPCTQVSIALAFLKDRGCVETCGRRSNAASATFYEDAMTEFHALAHAAGGQTRAEG